MNEPAPLRHFDPADEELLLATIDRWLERDVRPVVKEFDHADRWPAEIVEQMKELGLFGATVAPEYGGLGLPATTYAQIVMRISSVWMAITGIFNSHLMLALAIEKFGTAAQKQTLAAEARGGRDPRRPGADRTGCRHRSAGHPHDRAARWRSLRHQRHQDLDHQRHRGLVLRAAGQDRSRGAAALQRHEPVHRAQGPGLHGRQEAGEARLQVDRLRRADLRGLPHSGRPSDRRGRGPRLHAGDRRARTRPHQRRGARRRHRRGRARARRPTMPRSARPSASRSRASGDPAEDSARWRPAPAPRGC